MKRKYLVALLATLLAPVATYVTFSHGLVRKAKMQWQLLNAASPVPHTTYLKVYTRCGRAKDLTMAATQIMARRSDGASVFQMGMTGIAADSYRRLHVNDQQMVTDDVNRTKTTSRVAPSPLSGLDPTSSCTTLKDGMPAWTDAMQTVVGEEIYKGLRTMKIIDGNRPDVKFRTTMWLAVDADCAPVHTTVEEGEPLQLIANIELDSISSGEPDLALFNVGGYKELKPSDRAVTRAQGKFERLGKPFPAELENDIRRSQRANDDRYNVNHP